MRATVLYRALAAVHAIDGCSKRSGQKKFRPDPARGDDPAELSVTAIFPLKGSGGLAAGLGLAGGRTSALGRFAAHAARTLRNRPLRFRGAGRLRLLLRNPCHCSSLFLFASLSSAQQTNRNYTAALENERRV
jgi:hypothetical protein